MSVRLERFLAAIRSHGDQAIRQSAISNALHRARADRKVSHVQYRLLEQTASRTRWVARYSSEPQEVRAWFASLKSGSNVGRFDAALVAQGYVVTIEVPRVSGGWPLVFSTIQCSSGDRTGESHGELLGRARRLFNGQERAARAGYNWSAASEPDAPPTCNGYDLASRNGYDSTTQNQGASRNGYESASRNGYELIVDRLLPTNQPSLGGNASGSCNSNELELNEAQYERWRDYAGVFGRGLQPVIKPFARDETDPILYGIVQTAAAKFSSGKSSSGAGRQIGGHRVLGHAANAGRGRSKDCGRTSTGWPKQRLRSWGAAQSCWPDDAGGVREGRARAEGIAGWRVDRWRARPRALSTAISTQRPQGRGLGCGRRAVCASG